LPQNHLFILDGEYERNLKAIGVSLPRRDFQPCCCLEIVPIKRAADQESNQRLNRFFFSDDLCDAVDRANGVQQSEPKQEAS